MIHRLRLWSGRLLSLGFLPAAWRLPSFALLGIAAGIGILALRSSEFLSYLSDNPRTCINCHVMVPHYATWERSSHARVATCNDCHVPHESLASKYLFKVKDGMRHATIFTMRREPQVLRPSADAVHTIQQNCLRCHEGKLSQAMLLRAGGRRCVDCHRRVPHGDVRSLSSTPDARHPRLPSILTLPELKEEHE
ncbi:MAG: cytochrome c nitrite reductase small subunit [Armatimonadota bacterium]